MAFPNYKTKWLFFRTPDGWEDVGESPTRDAITMGGIVRNIIDLCQKCNTRLHIGTNFKSNFYFCPVCKIKIR